MIAMLAVVSLLTAQTPDSIRIERLATLGRLWYAARLFHPYLAYRTIDWDSALVATIPRVSAARTADEYAAAVQGMLDALGDPATHIARPQTAGQPNAREPDPRARWTADSVLVISATNYADLDDWNRGIARCDSFAQLVPHARAVVFDLRQRVPGASSGFVSFVFSQSKLLPQLFAGPPLAAPGQRSRMHSGYRGDVTGNSGSGYWSAWVTQDGDVFSGPPGTMSRPIAFVVSDRSEVPGAALALQAGGRAALVVEGTATDESLVGTTELEIGDGLKVRLRLSELVFADGTGGLPADTVVGTPAAAATDPSLEAALVMVRRPVATHHPRSPLEPRSAPPPQRDYAGMTYPSLPYRLLAAFRIWGTFEYFHAYKQLYDEDWTGVLKTFIPRLEGAQDSLEYALTLAEMVSHTRDNHVRVNSPVLAAYWGEAQTPLLVRIIQGVPVVTGFTNDSVARAAGVRIGDVIERVDGEAVATRLARRERYLTASTPQWLHWAAVRSLLAGPEGSTAVLRLRGATGGAEKGPSHEVRLPRRKAYEPSCYGCRTGPILRMLPGNVGYADLDRLPVSRVDSMFELFRGTRAIIFDMRGYPQGTAWPIDLCWRGVARTSGAGRRAALQSRFCAPNNAADWRSRRRKHEVRSAQPGHGRGGLLRGLREIHLESWQDLLYDYWCDWTDDHTDRRRVEGVGRLATHDKDLRDFRWVIASATRRRRGHAGMPRGSPAARQNSGKEIGERLGLPLCVRPERSHHAVSANPSPTPLRHRAASRSARPPRSTSNPPLPPLCKDPNRPINNGVDIVDIHVIAPVTAESGSSETDGPQEHLFRNSYGDASTTR